ncbi:AsmA-like C-terminal region-containing protein [Rhizobium skierniewicense]|uniref:AsmA-like C-terminal region-containing protein n=1 Tax=Rhizobium skierniewicense TaxID=984260 RepID=UPI001FAD421C|nr:AsmA-like C-terminal region-containing protein [Rhizobium skierniewicense]
MIEGRGSFGSKHRRMAEIRGEKVSFSKRDIKPLHAMPSAQVEDPIIVHCPRPRSMTRSLLKVFGALVILAFISIGGIIVSVETGSIDAALTTQAKQALERALGSKYDARIGSTSVRFASGFNLALVAQDVDIIDKETGQHLSRARAMGMALNPLALLAGRVSVQSLEATGMELDTALLPKGQGIDFAKLRVADVPAYLDLAFVELDRFAQAFEASGTEEIDLSEIAIRLPPRDDGQPRTITLRELSLVPDGEGGYTLDGNVAFNGEVATLSLAAKGMADKIGNFTARLDGFDIGPLLEQHDPQGVMHQGLNVKAGVNIIGNRALGDAAPSLTVSAGIGDGKLYIGGDAQPVSSGVINARYDFEKSVVAVENSHLTLGQTVLPLRAQIKDNAKGYDLMMRLESATALAEAGGEPPVGFDLVADGTFDRSSHLLDIPGLYVKSALGDMAGSLKVRFLGHGSPEISFGGQIAKMEASAVKQLWPFWMARKARPWVVSNLFGGTVRNGSISVFIPEGRMCGPGCPLELSASELQIKFDVDNTRLNVTGDIPPLRDASAHFELVGETINVNIIKATSFFPSNRTLALDNSKFSIKSVYAKPLMADLDLNVSGSADAVAELATFQPINALRDSDFKPEDFAGQIKANAKLTVGLLTSQNPPQPTWNAKLDMDGVSLTRPFFGRQISAVNGPMTIDNEALRLKGKARVDDVPVDIDIVQPTRKTSTVARQMLVKATLEPGQVAKLAPELTSILGGTTLLELDASDARRQNVKLDLSNASIVLPGIGWTKGAGIAAGASFVMETVDGLTKVDNFSLNGDGFGASGDLKFDKSGLTAANFSRFQLSPQDDVAVSVTASRKNYTVNAHGKSLDLRPLIARLRSSSAKNGPTDKPDSNFGAFNIKAQLDKVYGFNDEVMSNVNADVNLRDGKLRTIDLKAVTSRGQALVAQTINRGDGGTINLTSSDAGSFARFTNLYSRVRGGLLNLALTTANGNDWSGSLDMRNFAVLNEAKLQDIVATPTGDDGRSLNTAVRRNIDVSSEKFQRGFARVVYVNGTLALENGVIRGEQIGATFQGIVKDQNGNMDMTGTFMPAYGLNRLFAELPFIGIFLGNGRDRGLLGITFKLTGQTDSPRLAINPLSLIAPGVFRQIFEFQ